jgi:2,4-dienoyl-CoA reductase-like NADH-dependent reductase (Old Yellow Enzyme family)
MPDLSPLFEPLTVRGVTLRNRVVMSPMTRYFSPGGIPTDDVAAYYARRAAGGAGLIITEGVGINDPAAIDDAEHTRHARRCGSGRVAKRGRSRSRRRAALFFPSFGTWGPC